MNLYTADLMAHDRMEDRQRDFEATQLAALARAPRGGARPPRRLPTGRLAGLFRVLRRGAAV